MTRAAGFGTLPDVLDLEGDTRLSRVFSQQNLPIRVLDDRQMFVPLESMSAVFEAAAREAGSRTFGCQVGLTMRPTDFGRWMRYCASAPDLETALSRVVLSGRYQQSGGWLQTDATPTHVIWRYFAPESVFRRAERHHGDHLIGPMINLVRRYCGPQWQPDWVELAYPKDTQSHEVEDVFGVPARFGRRAVGVAIPDHLMKTPLLSEPPAPLLTLGDLAAEAGLEAHPDTMHPILSVIRLRLLDGRSDIDGAARLLGIGVQALQRRLRQHGLTYREVLDQARALSARALLRESGASVTEIALALGYSEHANFTRAFRRWTGFSPSEYKLRGRLH